METWLPVLLGIIPFSAIITWLWQKWFGVKNRALTIEHIESQQYFHKKNENIEIMVIYNNEHTCDALVTLRVAIKNTGKEDISQRLLVDPIKISFDKRYKILGATPVNEYEKIRPTVECVTDGILLSWALLKHQDQFQIDITAQNNSLDNGHDLAVDFYNSITYDINIEGIDGISFDKQETRKERNLKKTRFSLYFGIIYTLFLIGAAIYSNFTPDFNYELILQRDSIYRESVVAIFSEENIVKIKEAGETLTFDEFNHLYEISGIPTDLPNRSHVSFCIYLGYALLCLVLVILMVRRYRQRQHQS